MAKKRQKMLKNAQNWPKMPKKRQNSPYTYFPTNITMKHQALCFEFERRMDAATIRADRQRGLSVHGPNSILSLFHLT
ncbi:MAG: hypothetical protein AB7T27_07865 [Kiritimatiellia bacterium]